MNILMMTNTYTPIVGGLEKSVATFSEEYRKLGHRVLIVAPVFEGMPAEETGVIRVPAVQHFNGTDFSVELPVPGFLNDALAEFHPEIVHAQHPFLIGDAALRVAYQLKIPLVYTNHTLFEYNTHYVSDSQVLKRFVIQLSAGYANLADQVFVPSLGVKTMLEQQGVKSPVEVVPSGIDVAGFQKGDAKNFREKLHIPGNAYVVGFTGRLAPEKNLEFLARSVALFLKKKENACFLVVGKGPSEETVRDIFKAEGLESRLFFAGVLQNNELVDAYHAMDVFSFASKSETQGIALLEAMASGVPVAALDACGVQDLVQNGINGILTEREDANNFSDALNAMASMPREKKDALSRAALLTAQGYSREICAKKALSMYEAVIRRGLNGRQDQGSPWGDSAWSQTARKLSAEWELIKNMTKAAATAVMNPEPAAPQAPPR